MTSDHEFHGPNLGYILELYERYRSDPNSVDEATRKLFQDWRTEDTEPALRAQPELQTLIRIANLAQSIREYGYVCANLDPLGGQVVGDPLLNLAFHNLQEDDLFKLPADIVNLSDATTSQNAHQAIERLRSIYCGTIGYDYDHIRIPEERDWLYRAAENGRFRAPNQIFDEQKLLDRLTQVEAFELFLHRVYPGKTRFSIEGLDMLIPMLDELIKSASQLKIGAVFIGMGHRGRLNVLAHVVRKPYEQILAEFKDPKGHLSTGIELGWPGDVKYHMGGYRSPQPGDTGDSVIRIAGNPSHLEQIAPVIQGIARAANTRVDEPGAPQYFQNASLPIVIHGDAAFSGQGIVSEVLNFSRLPGYTTSGTLHIVANNQVGFTTTENELRSSLHASDLAKGFEIPVMHVNADDPQACFEATHTAFAYRQKFHKDFVINLIGYRRYGHNEGDEPRFTQPVMYQKVDKHPTVRQLWASRLEEDGLIEAGQAEERLQADLKDLQDVNDKLDAEGSIKDPFPLLPPRGAARKVTTLVAIKRLRELNQSLLQFPKNFQLNPKLEKAIAKRRTLFDQLDSSDVDWATAEELALASILEDGIPIRLTGEDTARGTFSQRHAAFYDVETNQGYIPMQSMPQAKAAFEVLNSPLSEAGTVGFEVGYNIQAPERLVLWDAQYGDFINVAQAILDEFLLSGRAKSGLTPSLVLLLPHGNEGMGPDHSSARIERFLGLAAETNVRIAYPSTAAQYFHLLRRQALLLKTDPLPLVIFTHKGLLRHPLVASSSAQLTDGRWRAIMDDPGLPGKRKDVKSLILCSGRIYVDLATSDLRKEKKDHALVRVEQLYPFPQHDMEGLIASYPGLERIICGQEEPLNMGAWNYLRPRLRQLIGDRLPLHYVGRPESSSPAEGSSTLYRINQQALIEQAFKF